MIFKKVYVYHKMNIKIVYFAYLLKDKWVNIVREQLDGLIDCLIYNDAANIYMSVCYEDEEELDKLKIILKHNYSKIELINCFNQNIFEYPGIKTVYDISDYDDDTYILYFHSKGITSDMHIDRKTLFKYTVSNYKDYISNFNKYKTVEVGGIIPHHDGFIYYNYFWCRSSYIKKYGLEPVITDNRFFWECWIGSKISKKLNVITYSPYMQYNRLGGSNYYATEFLNNLSGTLDKSELYNIWEKYPSDKCKNIGHDYIPSYEKMFLPIKNIVKNVLEIGTGCLEHESAMIKGCGNYKNGNSIRMWRDYFSNANIYAIDIYNDGMIYNEDRIQTFVADQSSEQDLESLKDKIGNKIDIIIDDGSHMGEHQIFSFIHLEMSLSDIGIYVIEDVQPEYIEKFKNLTVFSEEYKKYIEEKYYISYYDTRNTNNCQDDFLMVFTKKMQK